MPNTNLLDMSKNNLGWHLKEKQYQICRKSIMAHMSVLCGEWPNWRFVKQPDRIKIVEELERGCYDHAVLTYKKTINSYPIWDMKFDSIYKVTTQKIMLNLQNDESNKVVMLERIVSGELIPYELGSKTEAEMIPEPGEAIRKEWELRKETKIKKNYVSGKKCPKCKNTDKIDFNQAQKSSIDDGYVSIGYVCENCGNTWH